MHAAAAAGRSEVELAGLFLASAISSAMEFARTDGCTSTTLALDAIRPIGAKSFRGS